MALASTEALPHKTPSPNTSESVGINFEACMSIASFLERHFIPSEEEDTAPSEFTREQTGNFYLFTVAICHQTSPSGHSPLEGIVGSEHKRGWDYLSARLEERFRLDPQLFAPFRWVEMTAADMRALLADQTFGDRITEPDHRAMLVRDIGRVMHSHGWQSAEDLYQLADGQIANGTPNLLELLHSFAAYQDPVKKKSYFFLMLMRNVAKWGYRDAYNLGPPVDYHEMRGHLRLGTVIVKDPVLREKLLNRVPVSKADDVALRRAVHDAIMQIAEFAPSTTSSQLHYLFWNVFRSCCPRQSPHCNGCPSDCELPERYVHLATSPAGKRRCPFSFMCGSACESHTLLQEHVFKTDYY